MALEKFIWLVMGGSILATMAIVIVFVMINVCLRNKAAKYEAKPRSNIYTTSSCEKNGAFFNYCDPDAKPPPLPSREQFETQSNHSYEDMNLVVSNTVVSRDGSSPPHLLTRGSTVSHRLETRIDIQDHQAFSNSFKEKKQIVQPVEPGNYEDVLSGPDYLDLDQSEDVKAESEQDYDDAAPVDTISLDYDDVVPVDTISLDYDDVVPLETISLDYDDAGPVDTVSEDYDEVG